MVKESIRARGQMTSMPSWRDKLEGKHDLEKFQGEARLA
jgi:hypothetical protein